MARKTNASDRLDFESQVEALWRPALKFTFLLVGDKDLAEDLLQEGLARAWAASNVPTEPLEFRRWLYRIVSNVARDHARRRRRFASIPLWPTDPPDPTEEVARRSIDPELAMALRRLTIGEREAIYLRYFEDRSYVEVARILGRPQVSIRVQVHRALSKLRNHLEIASRAKEESV